MAAVAATLLTETRRRPGRLLLTGLAITVATVFAAGTFLLGETLRAYLTTTVEKTPETTAAVVLPQRMPEDARGADLVARVAAVDGVTDAVGVWAAYPTVSGAGSATTWHLASDPMGGPLTRLTEPLLQGRLPAGPDEVAVGETTATRTGLAPGRTVTVDAGDAGPRTVTVTGVVPLPDSAINTLFATPDTVAGLGGSLDQVDVAAAPGADAAALSGRVAAALGVPAAVRTGAEQRAAEVEDASASVTAVLAGVGVFAGLAVVAGAVVVASTFRIVLTQRRTQMALLRCVGARREQVVRAVLVEAVVTGLVAGVLGLGIALLAGYGLLAAMRAFGAESAPGLVVWWPGLAGVLLVAVLATVLAGVAPALAAARIPPVAALGVADAGETGVPRAGRRIAVAVALAVVAGGLAGLALTMPGDGSLALVVVAFSGMVAFAALAVAGPVLVRGIVAVAGRPLAALGGAAARLAVANAAQVPRRTAATISVLALGVGLTSALLVGIQTTRSGAERNLAEQFPADVVVSAANAGSAASLAARLTADPRLAVRADGPTVFVNPAPGVSEDVARTAVEQGVGGTQGLMVQYAGDARAELDSVLGTAQLIGFGLVGMTALVAVVGVGVTLMLSVTERTRETGLLRAVGLSRRGVRSMVAWEAALSGAGAAVIGAVIGSVYGAFGAEVLNLAEGPPALPFPSLAVLVVGVVVVAALAATVPAVRAGRVPPIRALQEA
ncbi:FtsX-like permease family protein [Pseudonocardia sp. CA-142604]|uniref:FtsX-like permease family protein n=1 Tax=Pseudonocardia sp. CA-142604 TaxID=3240024 RepID=UPI003D93A650